MEQSDRTKSRFQLTKTFKFASENPLPAEGRQRMPPPFSLRLTFEERARLEREAGSMALGAYIRQRLFGEAGEGKRPSRARYPVKDHQALGKVLGELGQSRIANNLNQLAKAANCGSLDVSPDIEAELAEACEAIRAMRRDLLVALGLEAGSPS